MAVAFDAATNLGLGTGDRNFTHTPVGTPKGVLVIISDAVGTDQVVGVTYGGTAMTEVALSPVFTGTAENGSVHGFFLGSSVPTGAQTVAIDRADATSYGAVCYTVTAGADTEVHDTSTTTGIQANPSCTLTITSESFVAGGLASGQNALTGITPGTGLATSGAGFTELDFGTQVLGITYASATKTTDFAYSWTQASEDSAILAVAITEVASGVSGDGALTINVSAAGAGDVLIQGDGAGTVNVSASGTGDVLVQGDGAGTVQVSVAASGTVSNGPSGDGALTVQISAAGDGAVAVQADGATTIQVSGAGTGDVLVQGDGAGTINISAAATGDVLIQGDGAATIQVAGSGDGSVLVQGDGAGTIQVSAAGDGYHEISGDGAVTIQISASGSGVRVVDVSYTGAWYAQWRRANTPSGKRRPSRKSHW